MQGTHTILGKYLAAQNRLYLDVLGIASLTASTRSTLSRSTSRTNSGGLSRFSAATRMQKTQGVRAVGRRKLTASGRGEFSSRLCRFPLLPTRRSFRKSSLRLHRRWEAAGFRCRDEQGGWLNVSVDFEDRPRGLSGERPQGSGAKGSSAPAETRRTQGGSCTMRIVGKPLGRWWNNFSWTRASWRGGDLSCAAAAARRAPISILEDSFRGKAGFFRRTLGALPIAMHFDLARHTKTPA